MAKTSQPAPVGIVAAHPVVAVKKQPGYSPRKDTNQHREPAGHHVSQRHPQPPRRYAKRNSFVLNSLILSRSFAAFSNSKRLAVSRISVSSLAMNASRSSWLLNSGMLSISVVAKSA